MKGKADKVGIDDVLTRGTIGAPAVNALPREIPWPEPQPVPTDLAEVPAFAPAALVPDALRPWIEDIAARTQCPIDYVAVAAIGGASALLGRRCAIRPKRYDDWIVVAPRWGAAIGPPGFMKTAAMLEALRPLQRLVAEAREAYLEQKKAYAFDATTRKIKKGQLEARIKTAITDPAALEALRAEHDALGDVAPPTERRYVVNDSTVEKLGELQNENPNGLLVFRDELTGWLRSLEREGHEPDRAYYCEAWNGTGSYVYDRIGRGTIFIGANCLAVLGGIQPGPLHGYLREAFGHGDRDDGLIQRFQLLVYPDISGTWINVDRWPDTDAKTRAFAVYRALADLDPTDLAAHQDGDEALAFLHFTPEGQAVFDTWRATLEAKLRDPDEHAVIVSHLAKYRSLMPALALLFHVIECLDRGTGGPVSALAAEQAIAWCAYLEPHARRVYEGLTAPATIAAGRIAAKITSGRLASPFLARALRLKGWTGLTEPDDIRAGLDLLESLSWVLRREIPSTDKGGRRTAEYLINPRVPRARR